MESQPINVIILPDEKSREKAVELGTILGRNFDCHYALGDPRFIPHATIYQAQYPSRNLSEIKKRLAELSPTMKPFNVTFNSYLAHHVYIWWNILQTQQLTQLHHGVLEQLNPLREGLLLEFLTPTGYATGERFTPEEAENVKRYGAVVVDELFQPHITLGKLKVEVGQEEIEQTLPERENTFTVSGLHVGRLGDHGTVTEILEQYKFG